MFRYIFISEIKTQERNSLICLAIGSRQIPRCALRQGVRVARGGNLTIFDKSSVVIAESYV